MTEPQLSGLSKPVGMPVLSYGVHRRPDPLQLTSKYDRCLRWILAATILGAVLQITVPLARGRLDRREGPIILGLTAYYFAAAVLVLAIVRRRSRNRPPRRSLVWLNVALLFYCPLGTFLGMYYLLRIARRRRDKLGRDPYLD